MRTISKHVYSFSELSETAKEKAKAYFIENWLGAEDYATDILDDWKETLSQRGFKNAEIVYSGFGSQGDGASFTAGIDLDAYFLGQILTPMQKALITGISKGYIDKLNIIRTNSRYCHENTMELDYELNLGGLNGFSEAQEHKLAIIVSDILRDAKALAKQLYRELELSYYDCLKDEYIEWAYEASGQEFFSDGTLYNGEV